MRNAPSCELIAGLIRHGAQIKGYDTVAVTTAQEAIQDDLADSPDLWQCIDFAYDPYEACQGADVLVLMTNGKLSAVQTLHGYKRICCRL